MSLFHILLLVYYINHCKSNRIIYEGVQYILTANVFLKMCQCIEYKCNVEQCHIIVQSNWSRLNLTVIPSILVYPHIYMCLWRLIC